MFLNRVGRRALGALTMIPGSTGWVRGLRRRSLAIVMYHGVTPEPLPAFNWCQLAAAEFARQIEFLANHYTLLPLSEVVDRLERRAPLPDSAACITFDDGYRNVGTVAAPILATHQAPATVFLSTELVGTDQPPWTQKVFHALVQTGRTTLKLMGMTWPLNSAEDRGGAYRSLVNQLKAMPEAESRAVVHGLLADLDVGAVPPESPLATMGWDEVERLAAGGQIDFGSHTHTHPILSRCTPEKQGEELRLSRDLLRERLGRCDLFAYPNGTRADFTPLTRQLLAELEYRCALTTEPGLVQPGSDLLELRRVSVGADTTLRQFELGMVGY